MLGLQLILGLNIRDDCLVLLTYIARIEFSHCMSPVVLLLTGYIIIFVLQRMKDAMKRSFTFQSNVKSIKSIDLATVGLGLSESQIAYVV